ncbi:MAG: biosynthetic-type acetolactate synthase large subunit [Candidatus Latescibacteria bacterium]|nr:biosynthetic-type acetolactate synthase large subunit [Candidatus Latescibacterota bacterium]
MKLTGSDIFIECLRKEKVEVLFGYPGGVVIPIFDKLYDAKDIRFVLTRHEQGAAHAADGYARATGKTGVCLATSGPGATNLVTGIATAYMDSIPMVAFTGQVPMSLIGTDAFQEADITGITRPITKHNFLISDTSKMVDIISEAFYIASTGRPGPVLVDLPKDVSTGMIDFEWPEKPSIPKGYKVVKYADPSVIKNAADAIKASKKPYIYTGGGIIISGAGKELVTFAERINAPVTTTLMGLGGFPGSHPLWVGMPGMHGTYTANMAFTDCDLVIAIGARFDDRVTGKIEGFAPNAKIIHIDTDPAAIAKNVKVDIAVVGDAKAILEQLLEVVKKRDRNGWNDYIDEMKTSHPVTYDKKSGTIKPQYVVEQIYEATKGDAIITTEVGQNQMWASLFYTYDKPRRFISSGGLGTMGYGFPAAIGAQMGKPDAIVFDIAGDGSIQMNIQEMATAVEQKLPVNIAILNNKFLGMVRQWQELFYGKRYSSTNIELQPDFVKLAEAYGAHGIRVDKPENVRSAIEEAISIKGPVILDFIVDREENVWPMVAPGAALSEVMEGLF